ncbi:MAG: acyl-CoA thioesterase [Nitrososphaerales archaeon]|nr:acyl-CoA thioesterase [Nitrososphaerales archaeon]
MNPWHEQRLRVRFEETDTMQVVYYGKFLVWMEVGRIGLLRDAGLPYKDWEQRGYHIPVVQAHADYKASARFDDEVLVKTKVASIGRASIRFENEIYKLPEMTLLCTGHTVHALIDRSGKSVAIPDDLREKLISF